MLEKIQKPNDIKKIPADQLPALAEEIRKFIIESLSKTGGHLASNLGVVELTIAMHRVFDLPKDKQIDPILLNIKDHQEQGMQRVHQKQEIRLMRNGFLHCWQHL